MSISQKYGRTLHFPFSPGTTSDDRINYNYWQDISRINTVIHTEKLDGENNCLSRYGVFARSHVAPTTSPWTANLREKWQHIRRDLGEYELFLENVYAIHSIRYCQLPSHYFVFAVREGQRWLSWEETTFLAAFFDFPIVPVIRTINGIPSRETFESDFLALVKQPGMYHTQDNVSGQQCSMEGIVTRNINEYGVAEFQQNVFKYVRAGHVKTDEHWTKNWKRAPLKHESNVDDKRK